MKSTLSQQEHKKIYLDENGNQIKTKILCYPNGADDADYEEVLLSDSEKFTGEILNSGIY